VVIVCDHGVVLVLGTEEIFDAAENGGGHHLVLKGLIQ